MKNIIIIFSLFIFNAFAEDSSSKIKTESKEVTEQVNSLIDYLASVSSHQKDIDQIGIIQDAILNIISSAEAYEGSEFQINIMYRNEAEIIITELNNLYKLTSNTKLKNAIDISLNQLKSAEYTKSNFSYTEYRSNTIINQKSALMNIINLLSAQHNLIIRNEVFKIDNEMLELHIKRLLSNKELLDKANIKLIKNALEDYHSGLDKIDLKLEVKQKALGQLNTKIKELTEMYNKKRAKKESEIKTQEKELQSKIVSKERKLYSLNKEYQNKIGELDRKTEILNNNFSSIKSYQESLEHLFTSNDFNFETTGKSISSSNYGIIKDAIEIAIDDEYSNLIENIGTYKNGKELNKLDPNISIQLEILSIEPLTRKVGLFRNEKEIGFEVTAYFKTKIKSFPISNNKRGRRFTFQVRHDGLEIIDDMFSQYARHLFSQEIVQSLNSILDQKQYSGVAGLEELFNGECAKLLKDVGL